MIEIERAISDVQKVYIAPTARSDVIEDDNMARAVFLVDTSILRDIQRKIVDLKDFSRMIPDLRATYKESLPTFDELAVKYIVRYGMQHYTVAMLSSSDERGQGNMARLDLNNRCGAPPVVLCRPWSFSS